MIRFGFAFSSSNYFARIAGWPLGPNLSSLPFGHDCYVPASVLCAANYHYFTESFSPL